MTRLANELEHKVGALLRACIDAYGAYSGLSGLAANLHLLALNAELAAGRAGTRGAGMRVLTQRTREFGRDIEAASTGLGDLRSGLYAAGAWAMAHLRRLDHLERARELGGNVAAACDRETVEVTQAISALSALVVEVGRHERVFADFTRQAHHIATAIAIEAAAVGDAGAEFVHVANTMKDYVATLTRMVERSNRAVAHALGMADALVTDVTVRPPRQEPFRHAG
jgi:hypothetical protein